MASEADLFRQGIALVQNGDLAGAAAAFAQALAIRADYPEAHNALGIVRQRQGRLDEALDGYRRAVAMGYAAAFGNLGAALHQSGRLDEAVDTYRQALARWPDRPELHYNLGSALHAALHPAEAAECYRRALALRPDYPEAHNNLGIALRDLGRPEEAAHSYRRALALTPDNAEIHYNLALALLEAGDLAAGWAEHEWRFAAGITPPRPVPQPMWKGEDLRGRTLLVWAEQGFGDTLQFARYLPLLSGRAGRIVFEVQPALVRLCAGLADAVVARGQDCGPFDAHVALLSLPALLGTTLDNVPADVPCFRVPDEARAAWAARLGPAERPRVAVVWAGNPKQKNNLNRSVPPEVFSRLLAVPGVEFHALQVGAPPLAGTVDHAGRLTDFAETAAALAQMDLCVTVDTSVAHLAGGLGVPVWTLLTYSPDWRYMREREDSPWYPSMRLFRQQQPGDWAGVVGRVGEALQAWLRTAPAGRTALPEAARPA